MLRSTSLSVHRAADAGNRLGCRRPKEDQSAGAGSRTADVGPDRAGAGQLKPLHSKLGKPEPGDWLAAQA